jgi:hypothetical protein
MIRSLSTVLLLAASLYPVTVLHAQIPGRPSTRPIRIVFSGGVTLPTGDFEKFNATGYHGDIALLLNFGGLPIRLRPEASLTRFSLKDLVSGGTGTEESQGTSQLLGGLLNLEFSLSLGPIQPYVLAGGGITNLKTDFSAGGGPTTSSLSDTQFAIDGGAGLRFRLGPIDGFIEGRVNSVYTDQGVINFKDVKLIPVTFGLVF